MISFLAPLCRWTCAQPRQASEQAPGLAETVRCDRGVGFRTYGTWIELRRFLEQLDRPDIGDLTVVLVLGEHFRGYLPTLIQRTQRARRLILGACSGRLPGFVTIGDLDAASGALGWQLIVFEKSAQAAIRGALQSLAADELCIVFQPSLQIVGSGDQRPLSASFAAAGRDVASAAHWLLS